MAHLKSFVRMLLPIADPGGGRGKGPIMKLFIIRISQLLPTFNFEKDVNKYLIDLLPTENYMNDFYEAAVVIKILFILHWRRD